MKTNFILCLIFIFTFDLDIFGQNSTNYSIPIIYKEKPKKKISERNKLNWKKKKYWEKSNKIFHRFARTSQFSDNNPANLAIKSPFYFFRLDLLNLDLNFTNSSLTPQFLIDYFSNGGRLNSSDQNKVISAVESLHLMSNLNVHPFRIEFGKMKFSANLYTMVNGKLVGKILSVPFSKLSMGDDLNQDLNVEVLSYIKNSVGIGRTFKTNFATFRMGINYNYLMGLAYLKTHADTFKLVNELGNVNASLNLSLEGSKLIWDAMSDSGITEISAEHFSEISKGFDIGFGLNLKKLIHQNLDVEILIENINTSLIFRDATQETYSTLINADNLIDFGDSLNNNLIDTLSVIKDLTVEIPRRAFIQATYQPIPQIVLSGGFEKYSNNFITHNSKTNIHLRTAVYPSNWFNLSYGIRTRNNQVIQSLGTGFQSGIMDILVDVSSFDGVLNNSNGIGISFRISLYF